MVQDANNILFKQQMTQIAQTPPAPLVPTKTVDINKQVTNTNDAVQF